MKITVFSFIEDDCYGMKREGNFVLIQKKYETVFIFIFCDPRENPPLTNLNKTNVCCNKCFV